MFSEFFTLHTRCFITRNETDLKRKKGNIMKKILVITCMFLGTAFMASAQDTQKVDAQERAENLSNQMIREFGLNNYQARKVKEINLYVAEQMLAIEQEYAGNQKKVKELCNGVCSIRDKKLENVLSTVQYNDYFGDRKNLAALDQKFMAEATYQGGNNIATSGTPTRTTSVN